MTWIVIAALVVAWAFAVVLVAQVCRALWHALEPDDTTGI